MTDTVSFDLDGTLISSGAGPGLRAAIRELGGDEHAQAEVMARHEGLLRRNTYDAYDWASIIASVVGADTETVERILVARRAELQPVVIHENTAELLRALRRRGIRVVVLTNGRRAYQEPVIAAAGLAGVIDELVASDDVGATKPSPAMYDAARGGSARLTHLGDRLDHDVIGANAVGASTVLLRPDCPITEVTAALDPVQSDLLRDFLLALVETEGTTEVDPRSRRWWPDVVATDLGDALTLLGEPPVR